MLAVYSTRKQIKISQVNYCHLNAVICACSEHIITYLEIYKLEIQKKMKHVLL